MPVQFNPRQGGFQSVAPKNAIEKAIDKSQQNKPTAPNIKEYLDNKGSSRNRSSNNNSRNTTTETIPDTSSQREAQRVQDEKIKEELIKQAQAIQIQKQIELQNQQRLKNIQQTTYAKDMAYFDTRIKDKSSGNFATSSNPSQYLNNQRATTGGFFGWAGKMLGIGKVVNYEVPANEAGTVIGMSKEVLQKKVLEQVESNPELAITKKEFERRIGETIAKDIEKDIKQNYQDRINNELERVRNNLQDKVNRGEISADVANKTLSKLNKGEISSAGIKNIEQEYQDKFDSEFNRRLNSSEIKSKIALKDKFDSNVALTYARDAGEEFKKVASSGLDLAVASVAPEAGAIFFTAKGASKVSKGSSKDILVAEVDRSGQVFVPQYPTAKRSQETKEGLIYLGFGGLSSATIPTAIVKRAGIAQEKELGSLLFKESTRELIKKGDETFVRVIAERSTGSAKQEVTLFGKVSKEVKDAKFGLSESGESILLDKGKESTLFSISKGSSRTKFVNPVSGETKVIKDTIEGGARVKQGGAFRFLDTSKYIKDYTNIKSSYGEAYLEFGSGKYKKVNIVGGARDAGDSMFTISGEAKQVRRGESILTVRGKVTGSGEVQKIKPTSDVDFIFGSGRKSTTGGTTKSEVVQLTGEGETMLSGITKTIEKEKSLLQSPKETFKVNTKSPNSINGISKQSQVQETRVESKSELSQTSIFEPVTKTKEEVQAKTASIFEPTTITRQKDIQVTAQVLDQPLISLTREKQLNPPSPSFKTPNAYVRPPNDFTGIFGLPNLGKPETGGGQRRQPERTGMFGKARYNPSLGAVLGGVKKRKVTKAQAESLSEGKYTGLEIREGLEIIEKKPKRTKSKNGLGLF